jgi:3-oxoacyl-[acyl-carrier-protein] synthase-1
MSGNDVTVISGIGLHSILGGATTAAAAFRCGMSKPCELPEWPYFDEVEQDEHFLIGYPAMDVAAGFQGIGRLLRLGTMALSDLGSSVDFAKLEPSRLGIILVLPTAFAESEWTADELIDRLCKLSKLSIDSKHIRTSVDGRLGVANAIQDALAQISSRQLDHVIVGAIDSHLMTDRLYALLQTRGIKTVDNPVGFIPGEAAVFVLLELKDRAKRRDGDIGAVIHPPTVIVPDNSEESNSPQQQPGSVLSKAILNSLHIASSPIPLQGTVYTDLNGTTPRALEFGGALVQISSACPFSGWQQALPALSFGETGAASALVATCMAVRAFDRGYAHGDHALIISSEDTGGNAAFLLSRDN